MARYSVQPRHRIFVKGYGFLAFAKSMGENICKNTRKILSSKYGQKRLDYAKQSGTDAIKTSLKNTYLKNSGSSWKQL